MSDDGFGDLLTNTVDARRVNEWESFGLLRNPFPSRAQPVWDVFHNQQSARRAYLDALTGFLRPRDGAVGGHNQTLLLIGGNRVGKTHFMEHHRRRIEREFGDRNLELPAVVVSAEGSDVVRFVQQVIVQWSDSLRRQNAPGLFDPSIIDGIAFNDLPPGDVRRVAQKIASAQPQDRNGLADLAQRWVTGERLGVADRRKLTVQSNIEDVSVSLDVLAALVRRQVLADGAPTSDTRRPGLMLFLDEFEVVFNARRDRRDLFFVVLRELIDACSQGGLFLCIGMTTGLAASVARFEAEYPALYARLKGASELPQLVQVADSMDAKGYINAFVEYGRKLFDASRGKKKARYSELFSDDEIRELFNRISRSAAVAQGDFFDAVYRAADAKVHKVE